MSTQLFLRIPKERVGVLIGEKGKTKRQIEELTQTKIEIEDGSVTIKATEKTMDPLAPLKAKAIVMAIGRGFNPEKALRLLSDDVVLEIIDINEFAHGSKNSLVRLKGRVIGEQGRTRKLIEELTGADISVYGHTVAIIGTPEEALVAKEAVIRLLEGAQHGSVYKYLYNKRREMKRARFGGWKRI